MNHAVYDVVIAGGGIIGTSIAYYASKQGMKVAILESSTLASGTSSKCDGNVLLIDKEPGFDSRMAIKSQALIDDLPNMLEMPFEYRQPGSIFLCENEAELEQAYQWVDYHNQENGGRPLFRKLTKADLKNDSKYFSDHLVGGIECTNDATLNPYMLTFSFAHQAERYGCEVYEHTPVTGIEKLDTGFNVHSHEKQFRAERVVNAAGVFAPAIGEKLGVDVPIKPRKGHILVSSRTELMGTRKIQEFGYLMTKFGRERVADEEMNTYGIALVHEATESQNFLLGSSREFVGYDNKVNHKIVQLIAKRAIHFFPEMKDMSLIRSYAGLRPWTPDHLPIISETNVSGFYVAAGHEGDGIGLCAITGKWMAEMLADNLKEDLTPLSIGRFKEGVHS
ncbi:NAD(P)/FAD-dependent oxidoreductase [Salinicoccus bachuensis]|uniref:Aerobic glycerol-3-phosphate dehydrogenase n=1 Tax=Salinicoccus bachuensis TaxID=3136731 RepID=A0ABZ3CL24_9STAP